jgi:hypothetical protein
MNNCEGCQKIKKNIENGASGIFKCEKCHTKINNLRTITKRSLPFCHTKSPTNYTSKKLEEKNEGKNNLVSVTCKDKNCILKENCGFFSREYAIGELNDGGKIQWLS